MMIKREAESRLHRLASQFKAVAINGCRQTGKTTLAKLCFPEKPYVSLENPDERKFAIEDPRGFLNQFPEGAILDEIQRTPELFSYLQEILDKSPQKGKFILTGSNNFLLMENISQSLSGRIAYLNLPTFSISELIHANLAPEKLEDVIWKGFFPPVYDQQLNPPDWASNYFRTYVDRDVRQIKNITELIVFERFIRLLAGRTGQELNLSYLSIEVGVDAKTIQSWLGVLEASYIIFFLRPYHQNFNKTIVKRPKVYFHDSGLASWLLGIRAASQVEQHPLKGALFETMIVSEFSKLHANRGEMNNLFYWRDKSGHEVDIVFEQLRKITPVEIKSGSTIQADFFKNLKFWNKISGNHGGLVLHSGLINQKRTDEISAINWIEYFTKNSIPAL